jgi:SPP1 gp7 family putative phage head morphogenesis protein
VGEDNWWSFWSERLAGILTGRLVEAAREGVRGAGRQVRMDLGFDLVHPKVLRWAEEQSGRLVSQVGEDVRQQVREEVIRSIAEGEAWQQVRERLGEVFPRERAERIARTEVIRAHAQGAVAGYEESGTVRGLRWLDGQAGACSRCGALHNKVIPLGGKFYEDAQFGDGLPPRHPNCRCAVAPVTVKQAKGMGEAGLQEGRRNSLEELTDKETYTVINGVRVSGERRRHWRRRHPEVTPEIENRYLMAALSNPEPKLTLKDKEPGKEYRYFQDEDGRWWKAVIITDKDGYQFMMTMHRVHRYGK